MVAVAALVVIAGGAVMLEVATDLERGSIPSWFEAIGTSGALIIGAIALQQQSVDRHEELLRKARTQARQITIGISAGGVKGAYQDVEMSCLNSTEDFIYDVELRAEADGDVRFGAGFPDVGPGERGVEHVRISWFEFRGVEWSATWTDGAGRRWVRTHRGEVRSL